MRGQCYFIVWPVDGTICDYSIASGIGGTVVVLSIVLLIAFSIVMWRI